MVNFVDAAKLEFRKVVESLQRELGSLRTGRANLALVEDVEVEAYGTKMALKAVASLSTPDARTVLIEPWDKTVLKDIERAIIAGNLGINPVVDGVAVRLVVPMLTEESRKELIKVMKGKLEEHRQRLRRVRDEVKEKIIASEREKNLSEDERFRQQELLDKMTGECNDEIKDIGENKEREIMTI
ncbi:MAG: ribosome recycling factor [Patescibacteria group bacterium]